VSEAAASGLESGGFATALRDARLAEAAHFEAVLDLRDAKSLRLQVLKDELAALLATAPQPARFFDLALVPGEPPRLWIDLVTSVIMEPDPRTYRLLQDSQAGREVLLETADRGELVEAVKRQMAHRVVARERQMASSPSAAPARPGYSTAALIFAWLSGFALGALILLVAIILLEINSF